jgi:hypothetical protein
LQDCYKDVLEQIKTKTNHKNKTKKKKTKKTKKPKTKELANLRIRSAISELETKLYVAYNNHYIIPFLFFVAFGFAFLFCEHTYQEEWHPILLTLPPWQLILELQELGK